MSNQVIRETIKATGVKQWEIAEEMGISEFTLSRKLRRDLPDIEKAEIMRAIERLAMDKITAIAEKLQKED